jgi:hypothetical protein
VNAAYQYFPPQRLRRESRSTKLAELKFLALLTDGTQEVFFEQVAANRMLRDAYVEPRTR